MKSVFFDSVAAHRKVAPALAAQAGHTLRPFQRFLGQAIHTAKQRQVRYQLPWTAIRPLQTVRLEPVDTLVRIPVEPPATWLAGWPEGLEPDPGQQGFVIEAGAPVWLEPLGQAAERLRVEADRPLARGQTVVWCGRQCTVVREETSDAPVRVRSADGTPLELRGTPELDADGRNWLVAVAATVQDGTLEVDGREVEVTVMPPLDGVREVRDTRGRVLAVSGLRLRVEELPAEGLLTAKGGLRFRWRSEGTGRQGCWVQLELPIAGDDSEHLDPRAAFCEGDVREVWTARNRRPDTTFKVKRVDAERYQLLLDRYPDAGSTLYLPVNLSNLYLQLRAIKQLCHAPLPHHQGLLRLCEDPRHVRWPTVQPEELAEGEWKALTDVTRSGTAEQRAFVSKALATPDLAILEGPPGSGKTTAICELVLQLLAQGQRVLLCASTHVAIDNVLERILETDEPVDAVRIGRVERVDPKVQAVQLDERVAATQRAWVRAGVGSTAGTSELAAMAERTVIMGANLTCGTTMGIVRHPLFRGRDQDLRRGDRPITTLPHWDVLIVDEASKTLIQEFLVPAVMARRWIIVGDVRQLPPFADRADIVANLRDLVDDRDAAMFPPDHQRACLLRHRLARRDLDQPGLRWLIVERSGVLDFLRRELMAAPVDGVEVVQVVAGGGPEHPGVSVVTVAELEAGAVSSLRLASATWVLVADDLLPRVERWLPATLLTAREVTGSGAALDPSAAFLFRQQRALSAERRLQRPYRDRDFRFVHKRAEVETPMDAELCEQGWLARHDLASELAWRLTRVHELKRSQNQRERTRLHRQLHALLPAAADIRPAVEELEDIGLPSILEVIQEGIGTQRSKRRSALTEGLRSGQPERFDQRFESLSFQHRMHRDIADFPREVIYAGSALQDANTIASRDAEVGWNFGAFPARRVWCSVSGREQGGVNVDELRVLERLLTDFIAWAREHGGPKRTRPSVWEVACLSFYVKQERATSELLRALTGDDRKTRFRVRGAPVELVCGTVDRFQGREADMVLLSMRNTRRVGFLDSPNRLNVAITRARQQLVVVGNAPYFERCGVSELQALAQRTPRIDAARLRQPPRSRR